MKVAVLGLGYVGCVTAACLADGGNSVVGIDPAVDKVASMNEGRAPLVEPGLAELLLAARAGEMISATTEIEGIDDCDVAIVCVGTPSGSSGEIDLSYVEATARQIGPRLVGRDRPLTIMLRSTVLPGTTSGRFIPWLEEASGLREGEDFHVAFCPEFLRESTAVADFRFPPFTIIGVESEAAADVPRELLGFLDVEVDVVASGVAESVKYASNAYHAMKVAFANEISRVCSTVEVDSRDVMRLFVKDRDLNVSAKYLRPGFAFGGSCLPKDVKALQFHGRSSGIALPLIDSLTVSNDLHIERIVHEVLKAEPRSVAQVGLTFKPATDDLRESPFLRLASKLAESGVAVRAYDPAVRADELIGSNLAFVEAVFPQLFEALYEDISECLEGVDLVLLGTNAADVCEAVLAGPAVPVVDLSGMLAPGVEEALRERVTVPSNSPSYVGAAW